MNRRYHPDMILMYKAGLLPPEIVAMIPASTRNYWLNGYKEDYFGAEILFAHQENIDMLKIMLSQKYFLRSAKAMYHIFLLYQKMAFESKGFKQIMQHHRDEIIVTIERCREGLGFDRALRAFKITSQQFYAWKNTRPCQYSLFDRCVRRFPNQISHQMVKKIESYVTNTTFRGWSLASIYYQMMRDRAAVMSLSTYYRYVRKLKLGRTRIKKKKQTTGIRATGTKKLFHVDVTIFKLSDNVKAYIYVLMDNYSRFILSASVSLDYLATETFQNIRRGFEEHGVDHQILNKQLMCDGGSENKGPVDEYLIKNDIEKLVAQVNVHFSNSMVEAMNKAIKYDFLYWRDFQDFESLKQGLPELISTFNNKPLAALHGFTPHEVFNGQVPSRQNFLKAFQSSKQGDEQDKKVCESCK